MADGLKVAIVDLVRVLDESKLGVSGAKEMEALFNEQQREVAPLIQQVKAKRDPKIEKQIEQRMREHEKDREKKRVELRNALLAKAQLHIGEIAKKHSVDFVLGKPQALLWSRPELDLTQEVLAALDA